MTAPLLALLQATLPTGAALAPALLVLLTGGLVGMSIMNMFDSILSDDDGGEDVPDDDELADGGGLMGEGGDDDFGDLDDLDGDDDLGGFGDDDFDDMGGGGGSDTDELEHRIDELETEVESISSTVSTVRTENEQISESVEEVEENVRKLLDIYEMVTRGVNPFADDVDAGMAGGMGGDSSFGLFEGEGGQEDENIDEDVASADAEGFFDDDLAGQSTGGEAGSASVDDVFPDESDSADTPGVDDQGTFDEDFDEEADDTGEEGGKSFEELKSEYESEDDEEGDVDDLHDDDEAEDGTDGDEDDEPTAGEERDEDAVHAEEPADEAAQEPKAEQPEETRARTRADPGRSPRQDPVDEPDRDAGGSPDARASPRSRGSGKPYLVRLPSGFASDMLVVEWLEYLLGESGYRETARAIDYYESIDWIDGHVADDLHGVLRGLDGVDGGGASLTIEHHTRSLRYISKLDGAGGQSVVLSKLLGGGGADGLQR